MAVQFPFTFYYVQDTDWGKKHSYQLWNKNFTAAATVNNTATIKTIYSPSPSGYVEPKTAAFTGFTSSGGSASNSSLFNVSGGWSKRWNFYTNGWKTGNTILFCALGFRDTYSGRSGTGGIQYFGIQNAVWTIGASAASTGRNLRFASNLINPQHGNYRADGATCRPVIE